MFRESLNFYWKVIVHLTHFKFYQIIQTYLILFLFIRHNKKTLSIFYLLDIIKNPWVFKKNSRFFSPLFKSNCAVQKISIKPVLISLKVNKIFPMYVGVSIKKYIYWWNHLQLTMFFFIIIAKYLKIIILKRYF